MPVERDHVELGQAMVDGGAGVWGADRWALYWSRPYEEQAAMAQIAQDSPDAPGKSGWEVALTVATGIITAGTAVGGLASGIQAIEELIKSL